jgi:hypothetical protein
VLFGPCSQTDMMKIRLRRTLSNWPTSFLKTYELPQGVRALKTYELPLKAWNMAVAAKQVAAPDLLQ